MINCLNTIYQLTKNNHADLARQMLQNLSVHLRYTLSSGQTVSLLEELKLKTTWSFPPSAIPARCACSLPAKNRCKMQRLCRLSSKLRGKHDQIKVVMGKVLDMHIHITAQEENQCTRLHICIGQSGRGFSEDILAVLQNLISM